MTKLIPSWSQTQDNADPKKGNSVTPPVVGKLTPRALESPPVVGKLTPRTLDKPPVVDKLAPRTLDMLK